jgi:catechol 2,3-dioxygenase-like lactoylglutathione lyase family enzyme
MFRKIGSVILLVDNMERSFDFYSKVLGLKIKVKSKDWIEFFDSGTTLALHPRKKKFSKESNQHSNADILVGFMVSDLDNLVKDLLAKNIKFFKEPKEEPFGKHTIIVDPDGHLISIAEITSTGTDEGFDLIGFIGRE